MLEQFVIYRGPAAHPEVPFVVRRWEIRPGEAPHQRDAWTAQSLTAARRLVPPHMVMLSPDPDDLPDVLEVWT